MYQIVHAEQFSPTTFLWEVFAPDVARAARPGQFVMLRLHEGGERIPLTIADFHRERGTITMVVQALGKTTQEMRDNYGKGDWFQDFVGPLGIATHLDGPGHVVMVGGGLGVAPVFPQLRAYKQAGCKTTGIIGFRSEDFIFWKDKFAEFCDELIVCTDDGSYGRPGFVTVALKDVLDNATDVDRVVAIGPMPMMAACSDLTKPYEVETIVSLNTIMVDGTGMCGSCRVTVGGDVKFACVDGPDFDAHQVDFTELNVRQRRFFKQEDRANKDWDHVCNLTKLLVDEGKRNYKKFKELPKEAREMPERDALERSRNFKEVNLGYGMEDALAEAERCIQCKKPFCVAGCPVGIDIPRFIRHLLLRDLEGARDAILEANLFPSICGRVCPQESQCEAVCILAKKMEPVAIGRLERFVGDFAPPLQTSAVARPKDAKRIAVVGSGPAGLACAGDLARKGYEVTVYEALHVLGGVLRYGIPSFRLPRETISRELKTLEAMGVRFEVNKVVGQTFTVPQLTEEMGYDAVFIGTGAGYPMFLGIEGEWAGRVYSANEFLTRVNLMGGSKFPFEDTPVSLGNKVVVLGAGNTAMDCLRTSRRLGATNVHCVYRRTEAEAPARVEEIRHAREEGVDFHFLRSPLRIDVDETGQVTGLHCQVMELGEPDASGRRRPVPIKGEEQFIEADTVIYALGTRSNPIVPRSTPGLELNRWNYIVADDNSQATSLPGVFAGGDIVTGGATVILALGAGRRAAKGIEAFFADGVWPPTVEAGFEDSTARGADSCPRCGGEIEPGEEAYVCCGGETVSWRCDSCFDVSEGFAFPYGMCPKCGGQLVRRGAEAVTGEAARTAIRQAFEVELGAIALYSQGAEGTDDEELRALFVRLAEMEEEHLHTLAARYHVAMPDVITDTAGFDAISIYAGIDEPPKSVEALFELAIELERRARDFFAAQARALPADTAEWRLYRELEAEEYEHIDLLTTERARMLAGKPGILMG